jgi:hypothetical protein
VDDRGLTGRREGRLELDASQATSDRLRMKVDEYASSDFKQFEIGDHLSFVHRQKSLHGLKLHDKLVLNEEVDSMAALDQLAFVALGDRKLFFEVQSPQPEFMR